MDLSGMLWAETPLERALSVVYSASHPADLAGELIRIADRPTGLPVACAWVQSGFVQVAKLFCV